MSDPVTRYDRMPIPPAPERTEWFEAGAIAIGVEYRLLDDAIAAAAEKREAVGLAGSAEAAATGLDDRGVSLHVCDAREGAGGEALRFDCFREDPHYHYISSRERFNHMLHIDAVAEGDPLAWALERIRTRLPQMLERAGNAELAARVDAGALSRVLPQVAEAALRARALAED